MGAAEAMEEEEEDTATTAATVEAMVVMGGEDDRNPAWDRPRREAKGRDPAERKTPQLGDRGKRRRRRGPWQAKEPALEEEGVLGEEEARVG